MNYLEEIAKHHKDYIKSVKHLGGGLYSEDIVQQMYIKIHDYNLKDKVFINGKVQRGYVWFILRSLFYDLKRQQKRFNKCSIGEGFDILDEFAKSDTMTYEDAYGLMIERIDAEVNTWHHYDRQLFRLYSQSDRSMRDISAGTTISTMSIFTTIKNCKERLRDNVGEHYKYFIDEDYEKL